MSENIEKIIKNFFYKLEIKYNSLEVKLDNKGIVIKINTEESGLLIGQNGNTFDYIQSILRQMINNKSTEKYKIRLEINDYYSSKDERLFQFIQSKIDTVKKTGIKSILPYYHPYERKKIHSYVAQLGDNTFQTKSIGE